MTGTERGRVTPDDVERDWLLEHGRTPEQVARMQAAGVEGSHAARVVEHAHDVVQFLGWGGQERPMGECPECRRWYAHNSRCPRGIVMDSLRKSGLLRFGR